MRQLTARHVIKLYIFNKICCYSKQKHIHKWESTYYTSTNSRNYFKRQHALQQYIIGTSRKKNKSTYSAFLYATLIAIILLTAKLKLKLKRLESNPPTQKMEWNARYRSLNQSNSASDADHMPPSNFEVIYYLLF